MESKACFFILSVLTVLVMGSMASVLESRKLTENERAAVRSCCHVDSECCEMAIMFKMPLNCLNSDYVKSIVIKREATNCLQKHFFGVDPQPSFDDRHCCDEVFENKEPIASRCWDIVRSVNVDGGEKLALMEEQWVKYGQESWGPWHKALRAFKRCMRDDDDADAKTIVRKRTAKQAYDNLDDVLYKK